MKNIFIIFFYLISIHNLIAQNLYDTAHIQQFADYLFKTKQYNFAAQEYEKLLDTSSFLYLDNSLKAVEAYKFAHNYNKSIYLFENNILSYKNISPNYYIKYVNLLVDNKDFFKAYNFMNTINFYSPYIIKSKNIKACLDIINYKESKTKKMTTDFNSSEILPQVRGFSIQQIKLKNKILAVSLSSILPGTGKIYCGYVKEGIYSLLSLGFQTIHVAYGFHKYGYKSPYPIFFACMSTCFYFGNIFGTLKAVNKYNSLSKNKRDEKIIDFMRVNLF
ncbi:MAG: hypothetical protein MJ211_07875 [Bacteroidales bacterium]|nr:hypothetical protein [Bacteroidales bacterium]